MVKIHFNELVSLVPERTSRYPFVTRMLLDLFLKGELATIREIDIEPEFGYVGRIVYHSGAIGMFRTTRFPLNSLGASEITFDKGYTKYFLQQLGYQTPRGKVFLFPDSSSNATKSSFPGDYQDFINYVHNYISQNIGYPCFLKPNDRAQGEGVSKCLDSEDVACTLLDNQYSYYRRFLVEEAINWPDYRVVVFKKEVIACYRRIPLFVIGDGASTIGHLLEQKQADFSRTGRAKLFNINDPRIARRLQRDQADFGTILPSGYRYHLHDISNLSVGGEVEDYTERICEYWRDFCIKLVADMGLLFCGVDIACADLEQATSAYSILELNAVPGLSNYAAIGEKQASIVRKLYQRIFTDEESWR